MDERMVALNDLAGRISASLDLEATLDAVVAAAAELIPCALAEVSLWDDDSEMLTLLAIRCEADRAYPVGASFPPGKGYTGWMVRHRQPLLVPDVTQRLDIHPDLLPGERPFQAYLGVPLLSGDALIGTLVLVADQRDAFDQSDAQVLQALGHHAANAIRNARLYADLARRTRELAAVQAVAAVVNRPRDLDQVLAEGLRQALAVTGLDMGAIAVRDPQRGVLALRTHEGMSPDLVAWTANRLVEKDAQVWPEEDEFHSEQLPQSEELPAEMRASGLRWLAEVPLFAEGEFVGLLFVASTAAPDRPRTYKEGRSLLQAIGHQLGTAIANHRLRQEALAAERMAAVGHVATSVAHDLRSPLGGIVRSAEFLGRAELSPATRERLSRAVVSMAQRLIHTTQGILDYVRGGALPLNRAPCSLSAFLQEVLSVMEIDFSDRGIEVVRDFRYAGQVVIDADRMALVVYNIAANARDVMPHGGTFTVATRAVDDRVELSFTDTGPGVPEALSERIFEPFFSAGKREGAGLGLAIARRIVEEHGGELRLEERKDQGALFVVSLPV